MVPSQLQSLFWKITYHDIKVKLQLFIGEKQLLINQGFQVMSQVVSMAFGGKREDIGAAPQTAAEAMAQFKSLNL
jgi:hypothetical protein